MVNATATIHPARIAGAARTYWLGAIVAAGTSDILLLLCLPLLLAGDGWWALGALGASVTLLFVNKMLGGRAWWFVPWKMRGAASPTWARLLRLSLSMLALVVAAWAFSLSDVGRWVAGPFFAYFLSAMLVFALWGAIARRRDPILWLYALLFLLLGLAEWYWSVGLMMDAPSMTADPVETDRQVFFIVSAIAAGFGALVGLLLRIYRMLMNPRPRKNKSPNA